MNREQIETILGHPLPKLLAVSQTLKGLETVLSVAIQEGESRGRRLSCEERNRALLPDYNEVSINN